MFSTFLSGVTKGLNASISAGLKSRSDWLRERQSLLDQAQTARTRRRLAVHATRQHRRRLEIEDRIHADGLQARSASSGLRLASSSKASALLGEVRARARKSAQATSVLSEALAHRLSQAALHRQG